MIHPKVHLRIPCYDFYFLYPNKFAILLGTAKGHLPPDRSRTEAPVIGDQSELLINWGDR